MRTFASFAVVFSLFFSLFGGICDPVSVCLPEPGDFSIAATAITSNAGAEATSTITVTPSNGFSDTVHMALDYYGIPAGASAVSFGPISMYVATLTLRPGTAAAGTYNLTVTGTTCSLRHTATVVWTIA